MTLKQFLFSGNGRISRKDYWLKYMLPAMGIGIAIGLAGFGLVMGLEDAAVIPAMVIGIPLYILFVWISCAVSAKRFHDRGMSGWFVALFIGIAVVCNGVASMPSEVLALGATGASAIASIVQFVILAVLPGEKGPNQYGDDPLNPSESIAETFE